MEQIFDLKYWYLRDHKLFRTLNSKDLKQLCIITGFKKAKKDDIIYFADAEMPRVFFLKKGAVKIIAIDENGNETIKDIIQKGDLFGELYFGQDNAMDEVAKVASDNVVVCSFLLSDFEDLMLKKPDLAINYTKFLGLRFKKIRNNYRNLLNKDVKERLKLFLMDWIEKEGTQKGDEFIIENYLTQNDIAQMICTSRQTATTLLKNMEQSGIIAYDRKQIVIKDFDKLKQI